MKNMRSVIFTPRYDEICKGQKKSLGQIERVEKKKGSGKDEGG